MITSSRSCMQEIPRDCKFNGCFPTQGEREKEMDAFFAVLKTIVITLFNILVIL